MPLFFQETMDADTKLGVWQITEDEDFFLHRVLPQRNVLHPHKRLQHLAGRYLLKHLFPDFPTELIRIADTRKPFLPDEAYHFSISHCGNYAAALVSRTKRVGVDIELISAKADKVRHKFISEEEEAVLQAEQSKPKMATLAGLESTLLWSCKEAVFKWYGSGEVDFREHMVVQKQKQISEASFRTELCFQKEGRRLLCLQSSLFFAADFGATANYNHPLVLSYVCTDAGILGNHIGT